VLVTVKAAPNPSTKYGETVCVAALSLDPSRRGFLKTWQRRRQWLDEYVEDSMCALNRDARDRADARSLALIRPGTSEG
jgi:hypothetical protein